MDNTGCGHNFATFREPVRDFIMDSLKYWKDAMGVDGYRFDLAPVLGNVPRNGRFHFDGEDPRGVLKRAVNELPVRPEGGGSGVDLISEPWGVGEGTFVQGQFPKGWSEWNAQAFRDPVRSFYNKRGIEQVKIGSMANAVAGSASIFNGGNRKPWNSVNIVTSHDGFTLKDLFSYNQKRNNQPWPYGPSDGGDDNNRSWDQGGDPVKQRQLARTAMMTMILSAGIPHINAGDEFLRTLHGNNNPWNLDGVGNYLQWDTLVQNQKNVSFVRELLRFRAENPVLRPAEFFSGRDFNGNGLKDLTWYSVTGNELRQDDFARGDAFMAYRLDTSEFKNGKVRSIYVALNSDFKGAAVKLPQPAPGYAWHRVADTAAWFESQGNIHPAGREERLKNNSYDMHERCALLLVEKSIRK
jgi:glycogen operon protein